MVLTNLKLTNFRSYESLKIDFCSNYNFIYGNNGSGKTNLVEAIYLLALTKSFRVNTDKLLIKKGEKSLVVEGKIQKKTKTKYKIVIDEESKNVFIDNDNQNKFNEYISNINVILFNPEDVNLINETPGIRRKLLNIEISKLSKEYLILLSNYNKILKIRNLYIKNNQGNKFSFEYFNVITSKLIEIGFKIYEMRKDFIDNINNYISIIYKDIFGYGELLIKYESEFKNKSVEELLEMYTKNYDKELKNGKTLYGIHHDDIVFYLDNNKLKDWGSVGQHKNSVISFKLAEIELIKTKTKDLPILILDDLFSEIDYSKITNILNLLDSKLQIFITSTNIDYFDSKKYKNSKIFYIENSKITEEKNGK